MHTNRGFSRICAALIFLGPAGCGTQTDAVATNYYTPGTFGDAASPVPTSPKDASADNPVIIEGSVGDAIVKECQPCSADGTAVLDCDGNVKETCAAGQRCGLPGKCMAPCEAAQANKSTVGCDYYAADMAALESGFGGCFVVFVANTWETPVHLQASFGATPIDPAKYAKVPSGTGQKIVYADYDPVAGLKPHEVAILFLAHDPVQHGTWSAGVACPVPAAIGTEAQVHFGLNISTGRGKAFHITTDNPVVAYQMLPYGGGWAATTGATLLLPTSAWDENYVAVMASKAADFQGTPIPPSMDIIAKEDTTVTMLPTKKVQDGLDVLGGPANVPITFSMKAGEVLEFTQAEELTGSPIQADKPIALFAGHMGLRLPYSADWSDHAEQQIPPVKALGSEYAAVSYRDRIEGHEENRQWRIVGVVDGTKFSFDPPIAGAPDSVNLGDIAEFKTDTPFLVKSQDKKHPFMIFTYMAGSSSITTSVETEGYGDPDFVRLVAGAQYLNRYVFFTDPTYPETNLVVVRRKGNTGFADVTLDCAGALKGWQPVGTAGDYEFTRIDLSRHNFEPQGGCDNGRHEMSSKESFGLYVWGWGGPETRPGEQYPCNSSSPDNSCDVSYGYPAGENVIPINEVIVPTTPK